MYIKTSYDTQDIVTLTLISLEVIIAGGLGSITIVAITCCRQSRKLARRDFAMVLLHTLYLSFAVFYLLLSTTRFRSKEITLCKTLQGCIGFSWIVLCTTVLFIYYLRVEVLFGAFYPEWCRKLCMLLLGFGLLSIPNVLMGLTDTFIAGDICLYGDYEDVVFFELMVSKAIPSSIFLILLLIPLLSCSRMLDSSPLSEVMRKQFLITALDIAIDMMVGVVVWNGDQLVSTCFYLVGACVQNILLAIVFADWRRRVTPWKITPRRSYKLSTSKLSKVDLTNEDMVFDDVCMVEDDW